MGVFGRGLLTTVLGLWVAAIAPIAFAQSRPAPPERFSPDTVLVRFAPGTPADERAAAHGTAGGRLERVIPGIEVSVVAIAGNGVAAAVAAYRRNPNVLYAEPNYRRLIYVPTTNEGAEPGIGIADNFNEQWGLHNTGQAFGVSLDPIFGSVVYPTYRGVADADIDAPEAWDISIGDADVTVAVLDTGVACTHLDLTGKCVDQISFVEARGSPPDDVIGHGTHVAGIATATADNGVGIAGVAREASLAALKVCFEDNSLALFGIIIGVCEDADVADALVHASTAGHRVVNMSFAGPDASAALLDAVDFAWQSGLVLVGGAGNDYEDTPLYPAAYDNVIAVGSTDHVDNLSAFSSFGSWVSVLAPGSTIVSTVPGGFCGQAAGEASDCYDTKSGTSMAAPHVAGLAALLASHAPQLDNAAIRAIIESSAEPSGALGQNMLAWSAHGRINLAAALSAVGGGGDNPTRSSVESIQTETESAGRGDKRASAIVSVVDDLGDPVAGASVSGDFSGAVAGAETATTGVDGRATLRSTDTFRGGASFTFCVTDIVSGTLSYSPPTPPDCASQ